VHNNEPHLALYADDKGLAIYKRIFKEVSSYLNDSFILAFEIGYDQAEVLKEEAKIYFKQANIYTEKDMSDKDRFLFIIK